MPMRYMGLPEMCKRRGGGKADDFLPGLCDHWHKKEMSAEFVNLTAENLPHEHLCCIIRSKKFHPGIDAKRQWLCGRLKEGHVFRKLNEKATVFIEYAPLETAWVPIIGDNYYYLYCLWVSGSCKGKGYGKALMEYCLADAGKNGKSGICMLGATKQKAWLSDQSFAKKFGFKVADTIGNGYELEPCRAFPNELKNWKLKAGS